MNLILLGRAVSDDVLNSLCDLGGRLAGTTAFTDTETGQMTVQARALSFPNPLSVKAAKAQLNALCLSGGLDHTWLDTLPRRSDFGLFITDMDSTLITIECIDELADQAGCKAEVEAITEQAMQGHLDFETSLRARVALLKGLPETALSTVLMEKMAFNPGAERLVGALKTAGLKTVLVSGGFSFFTDHLKQCLGFDHAHANTLEIRNGVLTGALEGEIIDAQAKARYLALYREQYRLAPSAVLAAGDGANDLPMFKAAGFAVAFRPKPALRTAADLCLDYQGLDALLALFQLAEHDAF